MRFSINLLIGVDKTTIEPFGQFRPFTIGFDSIFDKLSNAVPHNGGINIPYNIIKRSEDSWFIEKQSLVSIKRMLIMNSKKII